jgi:hypothetical protein
MGLIQQLHHFLYKIAGCHTYKSYNNLIFLFLYHNYFRYSGIIVSKVTPCTYIQNMISKISYNSNNSDLKKMK